ncbi:MAG TPA: phospholipase D-like domain-containing protein [Bacteroidota bacterium]|nr:phospholipase D-like domain-containing protein [Bacteroidota bacterium]
MKCVLANVLLVVMVSGAIIQSASAQPANHVVISEVYGGGGNSGSTYKNDFVELYNPTTSPVSLSGWSVQYSSAAGTTWQVTNLSGTIAAHGYFLVQESAGTGGTVNLPTPDVADTLKLSATGGKISLSSAASALSGANPTGPSIVDRVGYGTANGYEGAGAAPAPSNTTSIERKANRTATSSSMAPGGSDELAGNGYDSNNNDSDFVVRSSPQPQNSSSPLEPALTVGGNGTGTAVISPATVNALSTTSFTIAVAGDGTNTLDSVIVIPPSGWVWSESVSSISLSGSGGTNAVAAVAADTISIGKAAITDMDSCKITITSLTAPDSSVTSNFIIKTGLNGGTPLKIAAAVSVTVLKIAHIVDIHINNAQGIPAPPYQVGATVTVSGIITADYSATQTNIFVQDATGGVCVYHPYRSFDYQLGDSVTVTGTITQFRGLVEVSPDTTNYILHSRGNALPVPLVLTAHDVNETFNTDDFTELNEGRLVRINGVTYNASANTITDATGTTGSYITSTPPSGAFDVVGILKQYQPGSPAAPPYTGNYEVDPRFDADVIPLPGPVMTTAPYESGIGPNSVIINVITSSPSIAVVKYGLTPSYTDSVTSPVDTAHAVLLKNLAVSTVYHYQVFVSDPSGTNSTADAIFITGSTSSDSIGVFFNKSVSFSIAQAESAKQLVDLSKVLLYRISKAQYSIDMCAYSFSGGVGATIASALLAAHGRGIKVRVIGEHDNITTAPWGTLKSGGITVIDDAYDLVNAGNGLMHNKFYIFDHRDSSVSRNDWVVTGSWNATDPGTDDDAQNMIEIQDRSLAEAYTIEFNEMWGSSGDSPDQALSRFGADKTDNTPHRFLIGGYPMELYFSPSDKTTSKINAALNAATSSINVCMYTFTRDDLAATLIAKKNAGEKVHVVMDNKTDTGNEFSALQNAGVDVLLKNLAPSPSSALLHHKYAVIDADNPSPSNVVLTGSHNWSSAAETQNNENELVIHSQLIANLYLQEFKQRYEDAGGSDDIVLSVKSVSTEAPTKYELSQNYPNPFNPTTNVQFSVVNARFVSVKVYDILGREVGTLVNETMSPGVYTVTWNAERFSSGMYFIRMEAGNFSAVRKIVLVK